MFFSKNANIPADKYIIAYKTDIKLYYSPIIKLLKYTITKLS